MLFAAACRALHSQVSTFAFTEKKKKKKKTQLSRKEKEELKKVNIRRRVDHLLFYIRSGAPPTPTTLLWWPTIRKWPVLCDIKLGCVRACVCAFVYSVCSVRFVKITLVSSPSVLFFVQFTRAVIFSLPVLYLSVCVHVHAARRVVSLYAPFRIFKQH